MYMTMRKKYQRAFNKKVRAMNANIKSDNLWKGRFEMRQKDAYFEQFSDGSGGILVTFMRVYDKRTHYYKDFKIEFAPYLHFNDWHLWEAMNRFITEDAKVWEEDPSPRDEGFIKDYTKIHIPDEIMAKPYNFYVDYPHFKEV